MKIKLREIDFENIDNNSSLIFTWIILTIFCIIILSIWFIIWELNYSLLRMLLVILIYDLLVFIKIE